MDRTQDGLSMVCQLPQEPNDVPRALTIETRGWFIQEQEQLWLAGKLNANGQSFSCFNSKAGDQSVSEWLEFEEFDDLLHVSVLLRYGNFAGLTQICGESHRFSNRRGTLMDIHLFSYFEEPLASGGTVETDDVPYAVLRANEGPSGFPSTSKSPVITPMFFLWARTSRAVVFPAPLAPIRAVKVPGLTYPETSCRRRRVPPGTGTT